MCIKGRGMCYTHQLHPLFQLPVLHVQDERCSYVSMENASMLWQQTKHIATSTLHFVVAYHKQQCQFPTQPCILNCTTGSVSKYEYPSEIPIHSSVILIHIKNTYQETRACLSIQYSSATLRKNNRSTTSFLCLVSVCKERKKKSVCVGGCGQCMQNVNGHVAVVFKCSTPGNYIIYCPELQNFLGMWIPERSALCMRWWSLTIIWSFSQTIQLGWIHFTLVDHLSASKWLCSMKRVSQSVSQSGN